MADDVTQFLDRFGGWRRIATIGVGALAIALIFGVSRWASAPTFVPIFTSVPLETSAEITDRLTQAGIPYQLDRGGADVSVAAGDVARARVAVAKEGMPQSGRPGMELFDKPAYGMTDFTQRINYRRALEGELSRTIGKMRGVSGAQVMLALHETSSFRRADNPSEASVVLTLQSGAAADASVVKGIAQLVASSVDGLDSDHVTIVDDRGRLLSRPVDASPIGLSSRQLDEQRDVEQHLRSKAEEMISQIVGAGNNRVEVSAALNFDRVERTVQNVDPERQVAASEQKAEIVPGAQGGAGSTNQATTYENSKSTEVFAGAVGAIKRLTVAVLVNERQIGQGDSARFVARTPQELSQIDSLVRNAVGFDAARGDQLTVASAQFPLLPTPAAEVVPPPSLLQKVESNQRLIMNALALVFAFVIGFMALKSLKSSAVAARRESAATLPAGAMAMALPPGAERFDPMALPSGGRSDVSDPSRAVSMMPELAAMQANQEVRNRVASTVDQQPEVAAKLIRAWMKEA